MKPPPGRFWPGQDPIGRQVGVADGPAAPARTLTIVGIASDARLMSLGEAAEPYIYVPVAQQFATRVALLVRTSDGHSTVPQVREIVRTLNSNLPITEAMPLTEVTAIGLVPQRIAAAVAGSLGHRRPAARGDRRLRRHVLRREQADARNRNPRRARGRPARRAAARSSAGPDARRHRRGHRGRRRGRGLARCSGACSSACRGLDPVTFGGACALFGVVTLVATYIPARRADDGRSDDRAERSADAVNAQHPDSQLPKITGQVRGRQQLPSTPKFANSQTAGCRAPV